MITSWLAAPTKEMAAGPDHVAAQHLERPGAGRVDLGGGVGRGRGRGSVAHRSPAVLAGSRTRAACSGSTITATAPTADAVWATALTALRATRRHGARQQAQLAARGGVG